jgi:hypothetical protein
MLNMVLQWYFPKSADPEQQQIIFNLAFCITLVLGCVYLHVRLITCLSQGVAFTGHIFVPGGYVPMFF